MNPSPRIGQSISRHAAKLAALRDQGGRCYLCDRPISIRRSRSGKPRQTTATWDHRVPASKGGPTAADNMALACARCNHAKDSMSEAAFREHLKREGKR